MNCPMASGVYRFFGAGESGGEELLYVGKANNLRERVLSYFFATDARCARDTHRIAGAPRGVDRNRR